MSEEKKRFVERWYSRGGSGKPFDIAAFDTETNGLGGKIVFGTTAIEGFENVDCFSGRNIIGDMFTVMCDFSDHVWFAHNAQYDWRYLMVFLRREKYRVNFALRNDTSIFGLRVFIDRDVPDDQSRVLRLRDSYAVWPHTLRELADSFCPEFPKGEIDFEREAFNPRKRSHVDYAKRDVEILVRGLRRYDNVIKERYDVHLSATLAGTAVRAWERMLGEKDHFHNPKRHEGFIRDGYFGGLVFLTRTDVVKNARTYDINSSYPHQMREHGVPYGSIRFSRILERDRPGLYDVTIGAPENLRVPIIPKRHIRGASVSVLWPRGIFRTTVTSIELEFALKHRYKLFTIHEGITWEKIIFPFNDFVDKAERIRADFKGKTEEIVAKKIQNSLYGKFGSRRERLSMHSAEELESTIGYNSWDEEGNYYTKRDYNDDMCCLPQWSVWITANARLHLLRAVYEQLGPDAVVYGDTDSITTTCELPTGKAYGDFKLEKTWSQFRALAPKVYAGQLECGKWTGAAKGITSSKEFAHIFEDGQRLRVPRQELFRRLFEYKMVEIETKTLPSLMVTMKTGDSTLRLGKRRSTDIANSANWECDENDLVWARQAIARR